MGANGASLIPSLWASKAQAFGHEEEALSGSGRLRDDAPPLPGVELLCSNNRNIQTFKNLLMRVE